MSDGRAVLRVPTTFFNRPKSPRSTSAHIIRSTASNVENLSDAAAHHNNGLSAEDLKVPPSTPGRYGPETPPTGQKSALPLRGPNNSSLLQTELTMTSEASAPGMTTLLAGQTGKTFAVHTDLLCQRSAYFREKLSNEKALDIISYPELDEFAFALFVRWVYGAMLSGPNDFHSMQHYVALYVLAEKFRIERLKNSVVDLVRHYYRISNMTAPPYRLDYVYGHTTGANKMRTFLASTVAYRMMREANVSDAMRHVIHKGGNLATDLMETVIKFHKDGLTDAREGGDCIWHDHLETPVCKTMAAEASDAD